VIGRAELAVFVTVFAAVCALGLVVAARRMAARDALRRRLGELRDPAEALVRDRDHAGLGPLRTLLVESGLGWSVGELATRVAAAASAGLALGALLGSGALALVLATAGAAALYLVVKAARARRLHTCDQQMPQALEIMALALRAGHALPGALALAAAEAPAPLAEELKRAADEHALGRPIAEVLEALGARLPGCEAVNTFVVAVLVLQETGGNLIGVIDRIIDNARARSSYQARLRALTSEGRSSAKLLALLPGAFAVLAAATDPGYGPFLLSDAAGRSVGAIAFALWVVGILWTRRLVRALD
jgi:tight adherence protein B